MINKCNVSGSPLQKYRKIKLSHYGGYVARFYVSWTEVNYLTDSIKYRTAKNWINNDQNKHAGFVEIISIKEDSYNLNVKAIELTGLAWEWWRTVFDQKNVPLDAEIREFKIKGTTLNPTYYIEPPL